MPSQGLGDLARGLQTSRSKLLQHIKYVLTRRKLNNATKSFNDQSPQWEDTKIALDKMIALCKDNNITIIACLYGYDDMIKSPPLCYYKKRLESLSVPIVSLPEVLFSDRQYHLSIVDRHPNAAGHKLIADKLFTTIASTVDLKRR
jgi:hypothetical protein